MTCCACLATWVLSICKLWFREIKPPAGKGPQERLRLLGDLQALLHMRNLVQQERPFSRLGELGKMQIDWPSAFVK